MKKFILNIMMVAIAALNAQAATHEKVQLWEGGPYWATTNIGADKPEDYGLYFWWGDIIGYKLKDNVWVASNGSDYIQLCNSATYGKSIATLQSEGWVSTDGVLALEHDAAHVQWGGSWRMPTAQELADLNNKCNWIWSIKNGVKGYVVRGKGDYASASIFLPAAGQCDNVFGLTLVDSNGYYWSSVPSTAKYSVEMVFRSGWRSPSGTCYRDYFLSIRPVQDFHAEPVVSFSANGGTGTMEELAFEADKEQKLSKNLFKKDGYVFQGWAETKADADNGFVKYRDEALITIDSDMTLYAVWANPPLTLTAESANWSSGSITLKCEDADTSNTAHEYTLSYYDEETKDWIDVGDDRAIDVLADANGVAHLTDGFFAVRSDGILPIKYRVRDNKSGRFSEPCVTRTKYGIFVSPGGYAPEMNLQAYPSANPNYAETFGRLAISLGSFAKVHVLTGINAIYGKLDDAFVEVANTIKPGDICFLYFGTHGGLHQSSTSSVLALYNGYYEESQLANHIKSLNGVDEAHPNGNGVAIVGFVHACHSKAISDNDADQYCRVGSWCVNSVLTAPNSAWITATDTPKALSIGDYFSLFLLDYGWEKGWAADSDGQLSCKDLADYTKARTDAIFDGLMMKYTGASFKVEVGVVGASSLLRNITIGRCGNHDSMSPPTNPEGISAQGISENAIRVQASNLQRADRTIMFKRRGEGATWEGREWKNWVGLFSYDDTDVESSGRERPYYYQIRTMNGAGVGSSDIRSAWRIHTGGMTQNWLDAHQTFVTASNGDILIASEMSAANGCRTVGECYALGIDPEDPDDDFKVTHFEMKDGKPVITLNHTEDGSGNSFLPRVKTLGKADLSDAEWQEVPEAGDSSMRFFKVEVEIP